MVLVNYANHTVNCKIVYYGPEEGGKTSNLKYIYSQLDPSIRTELTSLEGDNERTVFFDFMSLDLGDVKGFNTRFSLYSAPGQKEHNAARSLVLNGADGVIFVADSRKSKLQENLDSFKNLEENLAELGLSFREVPVIFQYNKRDIDDIVSLEEMEEKLNVKKHQSFESVATSGTGIFASLKAISNLILTNLQ